MPNEEFLDSRNRSTKGVGLGIDAGGTFTDTVLYDLAARRVLAKAKSLTTYDDLVVGIRCSLEQLPSDLLSLVEVTSLSTTLATNALVQDAGHKVGLIVLSPFEWFIDEIGHSPAIRVPGAVDITGEVTEPLDEDACAKAVNRLLHKEHCAALVIGGYASVRNPEQVNRARQIAAAITDAPIVCAHEVSRRLNAIQGARTAVANARLLPVISQLIASVRLALSDLGLPDKLMVVKGDGTPVDEHVARRRPIETILSGPAASVSGARLLTGCENALVMDIGGTTTDCAILENGLVAISPAGARVGAWTMSVDAADIDTTGLGGDSRIDFTRGGAWTIGPMRNIPLCCIASEWETVREFLDGFDEKYCVGATDASALDVIVRAASIASHAQFTDEERTLLDLVTAQPVPALDLARRMKLVSHKLLPLERLEKAGLIKRAGLTPTDLLHVKGEFGRWDACAARRALEIFAAMVHGSPDDVLSKVLTLFTRRLFDEVIRRELSHEKPSLHTLPDEWSILMGKMFEGGGALDLKTSLSHPIIAIGAPAQAFALPLQERINARIIIPEHADVANAVGAIGAEIVVQNEIVIAPDLHGAYLLYGEEHRFKYSSLDDATTYAVTLLEERSLEQAREAGAIDPVVVVSTSDSIASSAKGETVFVERVVRARATGVAFAAGSSIGK